MENLQRNALGKGLSSLIPSSSSKIDNGVHAGGVIDIAINKIVPNPNQPRKHFSEQEIDELSASIKEFGVLQPIMVHLAPGGGYMIIAGERRWQAAKKAGIHHIPAIVKAVDETDVLAVSIIENIQRQDLSPIEEAKAYSQLMRQHKYTQEQLSKRLCKSRSHIANLLRLLNLPWEVQDMIGDRKISSGHAKVLLNATDPLIAANHIIEKSLNVRQAEDYIKGGQRRASLAAGESTKRVSHLAKLHANNKEDYNLNKDQDVIDIESNLSEALGSKVQIVEKSFGGQVIIDFYNLDQLDSIINQLSTKKSWL